jgi:hypothetical protein
MLDGQISNMKMGKLGQLIKICPQLRKILTKKFLKMEDEHGPFVCKVGTHHKNDFDEVMPIVQMSIGNCEIMDVLLDGNFKINIIFEHLQRKLGLKKPHSENGRSKKGMTSRADTNYQNQISKVYI